METISPPRVAVACIALTFLLAASTLADDQHEKNAAIKAGLALVEARFAEFNSLHDQCKAKGLALDYPTVTKTMLEQFIPYAHEDLENNCIWRAEYAVKDMDRSLDQSIATMKAYLADPSVVPNARRYQTSKFDIEGLSFVANRRDSQGKADRGPVFFVGYGHFGQLRADMPRWPGYGINMIQFSEFGPSAVFPEEDKIDLDPVRMLIRTLDDAARRNVKVDVLISLHYFPEWALQKWPHLRSGGGGFLGYIVDAPEAKYVNEKFLRILVPLVKDHPALGSFCLSNEPTLERMAGDPATKPLWRDYLVRVHGDIRDLNERYGTSYGAFDEVPMPPNEAYAEPAFYDWCMYVMERFAGWHEWAASVIREMAPNVPLHTKMMSMAIPHWFTISWGVDPELFGRFSDIYGNDCLIRGEPGRGWSIPYHIQNINYDLQRSVARKPIFNSENHPTEDNSSYYVPPIHFRNALWQGAIHGQGATTLWVWERAKPWIPGYEPSFIGNVMDRPGCAEMTGITCLDLNRFAEEVTALQNAKAPVAMLFSIPSIARATGDYMYPLLRLYTALNFCGVKVDLISERQVAQGKAEDYSMIVIPAAASVQQTTFEALKRLPRRVRLVLQGACFEKDPYNRPYPAEEVAAIRARAMVIDPRITDARTIWPSIMKEFAWLSVLPEVSVIDAASGEPVWGVEWLPARVGGRTVINLANLGTEAVEVKVLLRGKEVAVRDLFSLGGRERLGRLEPMQVVLGEVDTSLEP